MGSGRVIDDDPRGEGAAGSMTISQPVKDLDALLASTPKAALELARVVSLAARIEPQLLRRARLELLPHLSVSAEADLWFSGLSEARSTRWMILQSAVADRLRSELARDRGLFDHSWNVLRKVHENIAPAVALEEEITYLALSPGSGSSIADAIETKLSSVVYAIVSEQRTGLIDWIMRALPRLPDRARDSQGATMLSLVSRGSLPSHMPIPRQMPNDPALTAIIARGLPRVDLWVRVVEQDAQFRLEVSRSHIPNATAIGVPATEPVIVDATTADRRKLLTLGAHNVEKFEFEFEAATVITLRTAAGAAFRITRDWGAKKNTTVLVAGPAQNLTPWLREISMELGAMLAREGYSLVTTGGMGVEELIATSFAAAVGDTAKQRIQHIIRPGKSRPPTGTTTRAKNNTEWLRLTSGRTDVAVVIEGGPRTKSLIQYLMTKRVPVLPVGSAGAAEELREAAGHDWLSLKLRTFRIVHDSGGNIPAQMHAISELLGLRDRVRWNLIDDEPPAH
jgi:hypothetical protein